MSALLTGLASSSLTGVALVLNTRGSHCCRPSATSLFRKRPCQPLLVAEEPPGVSSVLSVKLSLPPHSSACLPVSQASFPIASPDDTKAVLAGLLPPAHHRTGWGSLRSLLWDRGSGFAARVAPFCVHFRALLIGQGGVYTRF
jgi:hypothetical protein